MYQDIKPAILDVLFTASEPLDMFAVADAIDQAPFLVRAELKSLKRDRLVLEKFEFEGQSDHVWELTDRGIKRVNQTKQMRLS